MGSAETAAAPSLDRALLDELSLLERAGLRRALTPLHSRSGARVVEGRRVLVDFASNDYLGLASEPRVAAAAMAALGNAGTGAAAAPLIAGYHALHEALELALARFTDREAALLFPSGYMANVGALSALVARGDVIYSDALSHASLIDGCRLSRATVCVVPHADLGALERALAEDSGRYRRRLIVVEGVYSMDGDLYPLGDLVPLARRHDAWVYVDDAHGVGVLGRRGRGAAEHWGIAGEIDVCVGTLGKAFGVSGAFVAGSRPLIDFLCNRARSFMFTTASPPAVAAAALAALAISEGEPERRERLRANARRLRAGLLALGWPAGGPAEGHIVPVVLGSSDETMRVGRALRAAGFLVGAVRPPTVPRETARLRITVSAMHHADDVDALLTALAAARPRSL